jgi:hypothetical protein
MSEIKIKRIKLEFKKEVRSAAKGVETFREIMFTMNTKRMINNTPKIHEIM